MARSPADLPRDYPDHAIRDALTHPHNLRDLVRRLVPTLVDCLDFDRREIMPRTFLLDDYREREADLLVRLPFRDTAEGEAVLVCILLEHQSAPDQAMPLRLLLSAVLFWEREWRAWREQHPRGQPLRLTPILPVVLHTGPEPWDTNRSLAELFAGPEAVRAWSPQWALLLWDLPQHGPEELLRGDEAFWQALAVVRAEHAEPAEFLAVLREALQRLESLGEQEEERVRWQQLLRMVLYWALLRRSRRERDQVIETVRESQHNVLLQQEVQNMTQQIDMTWEQELLARGEARGEVQGELRANRNTLLRLLEQRFQTIPDDLKQRIASADLVHLQAALDQVIGLQSLEDLQI
jgi:hypothetical protein